MSHTTSNWLQPDLLGIVSTFLEPGDVSSLLLTTRSADEEARAVIKKSYLYRNFRFIEQSVMTEKVRLFDEVDVSFSNDFISDWMEANNDDNSDNWKAIYSERNDCLSKADARVFDKYFSGIHGAVKIGRSEIVQHLIEQRGKDPNLELYCRNNTWSEETSDLGCRPLFLAALHPTSFSCLRYLLERDDVERNFDCLFGETFLNIVTRFATMGALEICLQNGVDVNAQSAFGDTSLHTVCSMTAWPEKAEVQGDQIIRRMQLLLEYCANPSIPYSGGRTPRHYLEFFRERPGRWRPGVTDGLFADLIALLEEHEHGDVGQEAD